MTAVQTAPKHLATCSESRVGCDVPSAPKGLFVSQTPAQGSVEHAGGMPDIPDAPSAGNSPTQLAAPRFHLTLEVGRDGNPHAWRFVLRPSSGHRVLAIEDQEPGVRGARLELLTLVRGLEALDQPSAVVVFGCSRYLRHGITYGLPEWRENGWQWERFGQLVAIKHAELWQRLDRAMQIHHLTCGFRRIESPHGGLGQRRRLFGKKRRAGVHEAFGDWIKYHTHSLLLALARVVPQPG